MTLKLAAVDGVLVTLVLAFSLIGCDQAAATEDAGPADSAPPGPSVQGLIQDRWGRPLSGVHVAVLGHSATTTDGDGAFVFAAIEPPYDLAVLDESVTGERRVLVYQGLTRPDPSIRLPGGPYSDRDRTADVTFNVHLTTPFLGGDQLLGSTVQVVDGEGFSGGVTLQAGDTDGRVDSIIHWGSSDTTAITGVIFHLAHGIETPGAYLGLGRTTVTLVDGQRTSTYIALEAGGEGTVSGNVIGVDSAYWSVGLHPTGTPMLVGFAPAFTGVLSVLAPDHPDFDLCVHAQGGAGGDWMYDRCGLRPGDSVTVTPRGAPALVAPAPDATVDPATQIFEWASFGPGVYTFSMRPAGGLPEDIKLTLYTTATQVVLPDLSALQLALPSGARQWGVGARSDATSTDEMADADMALAYEPPTGERYMGAGTTQPVTLTP